MNVPPLISTVALLFLLAGCKGEPDSREGLADLQKAFPDATAAPPAVQLANEFGQGVVALQEAKNVPGLTAEQLQTVEQAAQALTRELVRRAESGDARAKADLELIERFRSQ
jgi:hypothetical protein